MATRYTAELLAQATAYVARPLSERRQPAGLAELADLYAAITGQSGSSCRQCQYSDFFSSLQSYIREATRFLHPELMTESKYTFAPGFQSETLVHESYTKKVTADNLTDEDAKFFLKNGYGHVIVEKGAKPAATEGDDAKTAETEAVAKAKAATDKASEALKSEKHAHGETKKEVTSLKKELAAAQKDLATTQTELATAQQALTAATTPATAPAPEA